MLPLALASLSWASEARAQQSLFNVPAGEIARPGRLFAQLQVTASPDAGEGSLTVDLGVTPFFEVGCNVNHVPLYGGGDGGPAPSAVTGNAFFVVSPTSWLRLSLGGQVGSAWRPSLGRADFVAEGWILARALAFDERLRLVAGAYVGTEGALGAGDPAGAVLGAEFEVIHHRLTLMADWVVGRNPSSVAVAGVVVTLPGDVLVSAGAQLPSPGTDNDFGAVFELTYGG